MRGLEEICERGRLLRVDASEADGDVDAVGFVFEEACFVVLVEPDDDSVDCRLLTAEQYSAWAERDGVGPDARWADCVGESLSWVWALQNQNGYEDAVQLYFCSGRTLQLMAAASAFSLHEVTRLPARPRTE